uniref:U6 snRNA-associated Sm-like protein LSm8 n=1 Tax=Corethron hystrix TaxID=216773 RepID=A0A7S1FWY7_9STRA
MASALVEWKQKKVSVLTGDGRIIVGTLAGYDQLQNLVLQSAHERVYSADLPVELVPLGLYVIRGDNVAVIGEFNNSSDDEALELVRADPIPPSKLFW